MIDNNNEWRFGFRFWISALVVAVSAWFIYEMIPIITMIVIAFLLVYTILPLVNFLASTRIPYTIAAISAFLFIISGIGLLIYFLIPGMTREISQFINYASNDLIPFINEVVKEMEQLESRYNIPLSQNIAGYFASFMEQIPTYLQNILANLSSISVALFSGIWAVIVVIFMIFYMLLNVKGTRNELSIFFPAKYQENVQHIISVINEKVGAYIRGTVLKSIVVGILTGAILSIVGLPFSIVMGVLAGLLNVILYIGPIMAAVPAVLISFAPDTPHFLLIIAIYLLVQGIDSMFMTPVLLGKAVDLSPLTIIILVVAGSQLAGLVGIILAIPAAAIVKVLFYHYYVKNIDKASEEDDKDKKSNIIIDSIMKGKK